MVYQHYCSNCGYHLDLSDEKCPNCNHKCHFKAVNGNFIFKLPIYDVGFFNFNIDFSPYIENPNKVCNYYLCPTCNALKKYNGSYKESSCLNCQSSNDFLVSIRKIINSNEIKNNECFVEKIDCEDDEIEIEVELPKRPKPRKITAHEDGLESQIQFDDAENFKFFYKNPLFCIKCGFENYEGSTFCQDCGFNFEKYDGKINDISIICVCGEINNRKDTFCKNCGLSLNQENKALICTCGEKYNDLNKKYCDKCKRRLNPNRVIKTNLICDKCGSILNFSSEYCYNCGRRISKSKLQKFIKRR